MIFLTVLPGITAIDAADTDTLIKRIADSDKQALAELYNTTRSAVYGFSLSITKNEADAEDVLQETYIKVWNNAAAYTSKGNPMAWLLTVAKNLSLMKLREHKRTDDLAEDEWARISVDDQTEKEDDRRFLHEALSILTDEERQIVMLHAVAGIKHRETAELTDMSLSTVLSKYHRALKKLRNHLEGVDTQ